MTPPTRLVPLPRPDRRRHLFHIKTIFFPSHGIGFDIGPDMLILSVISDGVIVKGRLPYLQHRIQFMDLLADPGFILSHNDRCICTALLHHQDHVNVVRHDDKTICPITGKMLLYTNRCIISNSSQRVQFPICSKNALFFPCTDGYKIIIRRCVIISGNPGAFPLRKAVIVSMLILLYHGSHPRRSAGS